MVLNSIVETRYAEDLPQVMNSEQTYFYAEEAYELGDLEKAKRYYTTVNIRFI